MSKKNCINYEDRLKFLLAIMTENYDDAIEVGSSVLKQNPNDLSILKILSAVKDKIAINSLAESVASDSDENIHDAENMQINCDTSDLDSVMDDEEEDNDFVSIDTNKFCQSTTPVQNLSDCIKKCLLSGTGKEKKQKSFVFKEKMYRVIPMKMNGKLF
ncbi:uncharacterized protein LOC118443082 [Vespa mandarinia]|uniref:uncharacterized protein LOC118443082 n=1 Tax=Vespa mandarinia TaxID=7446 RepID=UPI0016140709|nr:uncharacterized protein LOC118443082 [Vespa mandarinia]XP_035725449.1 uncharacterized protein LOC118443082 [Vespa mandarinia]XP_035725450.1 uncharacterized protein LOC118443082 [Vespa mandarinia]